METRPPANHFWMVRFIIQATRGVIRDARVRRKTMAVLLVLALAMVAAGVFALGPWLDPREHPARFLVFWFVCGWLTVTALLLALLDLLMVRAIARRARQALGGDLPNEDGSGE
jgi:hypothetical protein